MTITEQQKEYAEMMREQSNQAVEENFNSTHSMVADGDTLIITDPCYVIKDEHWQQYCNMEFAYSNNGGGIGLDNYLRKYHNFGELIACETGFGDWSNSIRNDETKEVIGTFCADAGMVAVFTASDLKNYGADFDEIKRLEQQGCAVIIENYTGEVELYYEKDGLGYWAVIEGHAGTDEDILFSSEHALVEDEDEEEL